MGMLHVVSDKGVVGATTSFAAKKRETPGMYIKKSARAAQSLRKKKLAKKRHNGKINSQKVWKWEKRPKNGHVKGEVKKVDRRQNPIIECGILLSGLGRGSFGKKKDSGMRKERCFQTKKKTGKKA